MNWLYFLHLNYQSFPYNDKINFIINKNILYRKIIIISSCIIPSGKILRANPGSKEKVAKEATNPLEKYLSNFKNER
jgi:hypothetical protein